MASKPKSNICLGLDLDECLVSMNSPDTEGIFKLIMTDPNYMFLRPRLIEITLPYGKRGTGFEQVWWGLKRPYLDELLAFATHHLKCVFVWSAGQREYVEKIVEKLFHDLPKPTLVLSRDDIQYFNSEDYHKPLEKIFTKIPKIINERNTLFLDNKADNFRKTPYNGIHIPDYDIKEEGTLFGDDDYLLKLKEWLSRPEVMYATDVRRLDKSKIFTARHPSFPHTKTSYSLRYPIQIKAH